MGIVFGRIDLEVPKHEVVSRHEGYEFRRYPAQVAASVCAQDFADAQPNDKPERFQDEAFRTLARYIGVFTTPQNTKRSQDADAKQQSEPIAMTAPVLMQPQPIAMTAPVLMQPQPIAMTAPVLMQPQPIAMTAPVLMHQEQGQGKDDGKEGKGETMSFLLPASFTLETAPVPTDKRVHISMFPPRVEAVSTFSGNWRTHNVQPKVKELEDMLKRDGLIDKAHVNRWYFAGYNPPFTLPFLKTNEVHIPVDI